MQIVQLSRVRLSMGTLQLYQNGLARELGRCFEAGQGQLVHIGSSTEGRGELEA